MWGRVWGLFNFVVFLFIFFSFFLLLWMHRFSSNLLTPACRGNTESESLMFHPLQPSTQGDASEWSRCLGLNLFTKQHLFDLFTCSLAFVRRLWESSQERAAFCQGLKEGTSHWSKKKQARRRGKETWLAVWYSSKPEKKKTNEKHILGPENGNTAKWQVLPLPAPALESHRLISGQVTALRPLPFIDDCLGNDANPYGKHRTRLCWNMNRNKVPLHMLRRPECF